MLYCASLRTRVVTLIANYYNIFTKDCNPNIYIFEMKKKLFLFSFKG